MPDIEDGESVEIQGSAKDPYILKNTGGVYSCSCPAWRTQSLAIEQRTCKHLRKYRGDAAETERLGGELPAKAAVSRRKPAAKTISGADEVEVSSDVPGLLLAHSWDNSLDLSGWWMSEKLDGVRAYWDGKQFISRQGNVYMAPDWFTEDLPKDVHLDGELWIARKAFQRTVSVVRRQDKSKEWEEVKYLVFDAPKVDDVFEARLAFLQQCLDEAQPRYATPHAQERCKNVQHLLEELQRVEEFGGEGLMLRQPNSRYEVGRSSTLLKVKTFHDAEARVLEHLPGTGKHKGRMGALSVELKDGIKFSIGTGFSDKERNNPPPVGSIVTFRYQELTDRGVPRFPSYVRLRTDLDHLPDAGADVSGRTVTELSLVESPAEPVQGDDTAGSVGHVSTASNVINFAPRGHSDRLSEDAGPPGSEDDSDDDSEDGVTYHDRYSAGQTKCYCSLCEPTLAGSKSAANASAKAAVSAVTAAQPKAAAVAKSAGVATATDVRTFTFVEGSSSKFWSIRMNGCDVTVSYGRIGTKGQEKTKSFPTESAAQKYHDEIIEEKVNKGYEEQED